jgi:hypothetical protein
MGFPILQAKFLPEASRAMHVIFRKINGWNT